MNDKVKRLTALGALTALIVILQFISNYVAIGPVSITLSLICIVIGAYLYGPIAGLFLGLVNGAIVLTAPSTQFFLAYKPLWTVLVCLLKMGIAGLVAGFMPMIFKKHEKVGVIVASLLVPIINTGLFAIGSLLFFMDLFNNSVAYLFLSVIGINFLIEFGVNALLSPSVYFIIKVVKTKYYPEI